MRNPRQLTSSMTFHNSNQQSNRPNDSHSQLALCNARFRSPVALAALQILRRVVQV